MTEGDLTSDDTILTPEEEELAEIRKGEILARNAAGLDAVMEERPLAKMEEQLREAEEKEEAEHGKIENKEKEEAKEGEGEEEREETGKEGEASEATNGKAPGTNGTTTSRSSTPKPEKHARKALLKNDDYELHRVQKVSSGFVPLAEAKAAANTKRR